jgi:2,3-bisphosphoglycerate-dependent phosphoglycerate mutase
VAIEVVFEKHSTSTDNEQGIATGWLPGRLSERGKAQARELGRRRRDDGIAAVFSSDLARAVETTTIAFAGSDLPLLYDWRLRECDHGLLNGTPAAELRSSSMDYLDQAYPGGESWRQATSRVARFFGDLPSRWSGRRILVVCGKRAGSAVMRVPRPSRGRGAGHTMDAAWFRPWGTGGAAVRCGRRGVCGHAGGFRSNRSKAAQRPAVPDRLPSDHVSVTVCNVAGTRLHSDLPCSDAGHARWAAKPGPGRAPVG